MDLFSVKKGKALKITNIILFLWMIGLLMATFSSLVNILFSATNNINTSLSTYEVKSFVILLGMTSIVAGSLYFINKDK